MPLSIDIQLQSLELLQKCFIVNSFYCYLLDHDYLCKANTFINRCRVCANNRNINMSAFIFDDSYARTAKRNIVSAYNSSQGNDGLLDTLRSLLNCGNNEPLNIFLREF